MTWYADFQTGARTWEDACPLQAQSETEALREAKKIAEQEVVTLVGVWTDDE